MFIKEAVICEVERLQQSARVFPEKPQAKKAAFHNGGRGNRMGSMKATHVSLAGQEEDGFLQYFPGLTKVGSRFGEIEA